MFLTIDVESSILAGLIIIVIIIECLVYGTGSLVPGPLQRSQWMRGHEDLVAAKVGTSRLHTCIQIQRGL